MSARKRVAGRRTRTAGWVIGCGLAAAVLVACGHANPSVETTTNTTAPTVTAEPDGSFPPSSEAPPPVTSAPLSADPDPGSLVLMDHAIDGDTAVTQAGAHIRILGLDAPETQNGHHDCFGIESTTEATALLANEAVVLISDAQQGDKDRYGRYLRYIMLPDGRDFTTAMIRGGYGHNYTAYPVARSEQYADAQRQAQAEKLGGWAPAPQGCGWTK